MIRVDIEDDGRLEIWTVDRPASANAIDRATAEQLEGLVSLAEQRAASADDPLRAIILAAAGPPEGKRAVYLSGADLREVQALADEAVARSFAGAMMQRLARLEELPLLVLAAITGDVFGGGCEIITACDLRIAEEGIELEFRQTRIGVASGWGGTTRLVRLIGLGAAKKLLLTGLPCDAAEGLRIGLFDEVVATGEALDRARVLAKVAGAGSRAALAAMKRGLLEACELDRQTSYARELDRFVETWRGPDHREALAALREKRPPRFR